MEYPICDRGNCGFERLDDFFAEDILKHFGKSLKELDEQTRTSLATPQLNHREWVPSYETCKKFGFRPLAVVDVACARKGRITQIWEITKTSPLTKAKVGKIYSHLPDLDELYEIKVKDIMSIRNVNIEPEKMYNFLVSKAKKWENPM
jgi:hypothetical protein